MERVEIMNWFVQLSGDFRRSSSCNWFISYFTAVISL